MGHIAWSTKLKADGIYFRWIVQKGDKVEIGFHDGSEMSFSGIKTERDLGLLLDVIRFWLFHAKS